MPSLTAVNASAGTNKEHTSVDIKMRKEMMRKERHALEELITLNVLNDMKNEKPPIIFYFLF